MGSKWRSKLMAAIRGRETAPELAVLRIQDIDRLFEDWRGRLTGAQSGRPQMVLHLFAKHALWTVGGIAKELGVAYTTAQRAIDRLRRPTSSRWPGRRNETASIVHGK